MVQGLFDEEERSDTDSRTNEPDAPDEPKFIPVPFEPPSVEETMRRSGLAYSAGIVFFGSIAFMMFLGWIADLVFGTKPWGLVVGIVLGSVIGFIQLFRISSQILNQEKPDGRIHSLLSQDDDDEANRR